MPQLQGEVAAALNDPNAAIQIAFGPPFPQLVPQDPRTGLKLGNLCETQPKRLMFKKAHLSKDDFRIFDQASGRLVAVSHHYGKNPYESLDPLGVGYNPNQVTRYNLIGEMESLCEVTGYCGMPSFKVRPKSMSMHGRQLAMDKQNRVLFNIGKLSRIKSMSLRHNMAVCLGETKDDEVYTVECDLMGRTLAFKNKQEQMVAFAAMTKTALVTNVVLGSGSEMIVDVAPGVDWTAIAGCMMVIQQVGAHYLKDMFDMWVTQPATNYVQDSVVEATGMQGVVNSAANMTNSVQHSVAQGQQSYQKFQNMY